MNFHLPGWFSRYLAFRLEHPFESWNKIKNQQNSQIDPQLSGETFTRDEWYYQILRQNGVLFGCPNTNIEKIQRNDELRFLSDQDRATFINIESLFGVLLMEVGSLVSCLSSYSEFLARTALRTVQFYLSSDIDSRYFSMNVESLLGDRPFIKLTKKFEKRFLNRIKPVSHFTFESMLQNSFAFFDIYGLIQWHRRFHNRKETPIYYLAQIEADHTALQQQLFLIFAGLIWNSEKELGSQRSRLMNFIADRKAKLLLRDKKFEMLKHYVKTTRLPFCDKRTLLSMVKKTVNLKSIRLRISDPFINHFMLEQTILLSLIDGDIDPYDIPFIKDLANYLAISDEDLQARISSVADFFHFRQDCFDFIRGSRALYHMKENINRQITNLIKRNLSHILSEIKRTEELYIILTNSNGLELTPKEKKFVKEQLLSIAKTIPALAIFCLPAGGLVLAILINVLPFNILPNSFAD